MVDTLIPGLGPAQGPELGDTIFEEPGEIGVVDEESLITLNLGPQHPSTHGVFRLIMQLQGETVIGAIPVMGYLHRSSEKLGEVRTYVQGTVLTDRMDYLAGMNMNLGFSLAVEKLCGMKLPEKANVIRVIIAEMNRIASHLVGMGAYGLDLGTFSPFLYAFREREQILDLFEELCGARLTYSYVTIGGVHDDLPPGWAGRSPPSSGPGGWGGCATSAGR